MARLSVQITGFVQKHQPPIVACEFTDADGNRHTIVDKVPIFTTKWLSAESSYPQAGGVGCEVLQLWRDADGRKLAHITTERPDRIESVEGKSDFVVLASHLSGIQR